MKWIIVEKNQNFQETYSGARFLAWPVIDDNNVQQTLDIVYDPAEDKGYHIAVE